MSFKLLLSNNLDTVLTDNNYKVITEQKIYTSFKTTLNDQVCKDVNIQLLTGNMLTIPEKFQIFVENDICTLVFQEGCQLNKTLQLFFKASATINGIDYYDVAPLKLFALPKNIQSHGLYTNNNYILVDNNGNITNNDLICQIIRNFGGEQDFLDLPYKDYKVQYALSNDLDNVYNYILPLSHIDNLNDNEFIEFTLLYQDNIIDSKKILINTCKNLVVDIDNETDTIPVDIDYLLVNEITLSPEISVFFGQQPGIINLEQVQVDIKCDNDIDFTKALEFTPVLSADESTLKFDITAPIRTKFPKKCDIIFTIPCYKPGQDDIMYKRKISYTINAIPSIQPIYELLLNTSVIKQEPSGKCNPIFIEATKYKKTGAINEQTDYGHIIYTIDGKPAVIYDGAPINSKEITTNIKFEYIDEYGNLIDKETLFVVKDGENAPELDIQTLLQVTKYYIATSDNVLIPTYDDIWTKNNVPDTWNKEHPYCWMYEESLYLTYDGETKTTKSTPIISSIIPTATGAPFTKTVYCRFAPTYEYTYNSGFGDQEDIPDIDHADDVTLPSIPAPDDIYDPNNFLTGSGFLIVPPLRPVGGTYDNPMPVSVEEAPTFKITAEFYKNFTVENWTDYIPEGDELLWVSSRSYSQEDETETEWSQPARSLQNISVQTLYSPYPDIPLNGKPVKIYYYGKKLQNVPPYWGHYELQEDGTYKQWRYEEPQANGTIIFQKTIWHETPPKDGEGKVRPILYKAEREVLGNIYSPDWVITKVTGNDGVGIPGRSGDFTAFAFARIDMDVDLSNITLQAKPNDSYNADSSLHVPANTNVRYQGRDWVVVWYDTIPSGDGTVWMTSRVYKVDDPNTTWSNPALQADSNTLDIEFNCNDTEEPPQAPSGEPFQIRDAEGWYNADNIPTEQKAIWRAERRVRNGKWLDTKWVITRIYGEKGEPGEPGVPGDSANAVQGCVIRQSDFVISDNSDTRYYNDTLYVPLELYTIKYIDVVSYKDLWFMCVYMPQRVPQDGGEPFVSPTDRGHGIAFPYGDLDANVFSEKDPAAAWKEWDGEKAEEVKSAWALIEDHEPIKTSLIIAENAVIKMGQGNEFLLMNDNQIVGGLSGYSAVGNENPVRIFVGTNMDSSTYETDATKSKLEYNKELAPFRIYEDGSFYAKNANIDGDINHLSSENLFNVNLQHGEIIYASDNSQIIFTKRLDTDNNTILPCIAFTDNAGRIQTYLDEKGIHTAYNSADYNMIEFLRDEFIQDAVGSITTTATIAEQIDNTFNIGNELFEETFQFYPTLNINALTEAGYTIKVNDSDGEIPLDINDYKSTELLSHHVPYDRIIGDHAYTVTDAKNTAQYEYFDKNNNKITIKAVDSSGNVKNVFQKTITLYYKSSDRNIYYLKTKSSLKDASLAGDVRLDGIGLTAARSGWNMPYACEPLNNITYIIKKSEFYNTVLCNWNELTVTTDASGAESGIGDFPTTNSYSIQPLASSATTEVGGQNNNTKPGVETTVEDSFVWTPPSTSFDDNATSPDIVKPSQPGGYQSTNDNNRTTPDLKLKNNIYPEYSRYYQKFHEEILKESDYTLSSHITKHYFGDGPLQVYNRGISYGVNKQFRDLFPYQIMMEFNVKKIANSDGIQTAWLKTVTPDASGNIEPDSDNTVYDTVTSAYLLDIQSYDFFNSTLNDNHPLKSNPNNDGKKLFPINITWPLFHNYAISVKEYFGQFNNFFNSIINLTDIYFNLYKSTFFGKDNKNAYQYAEQLYLSNIYYVNDIDPAIRAAEPNKRAIYQTTYANTNKARPTNPASYPYFNYYTNTDLDENIGLYPLNDYWHNNMGGDNRQNRDEYFYFSHDTKDEKSPMDIGGPSKNVAVHDNFYKDRPYTMMLAYGNVDNALITTPDKNNQLPVYHPQIHKILDLSTYTYPTLSNDVFGIHTICKPLTDNAKDIGLNRIYSNADDNDIRYASQSLTGPGDKISEYILYREQILFENGRKRIYSTYWNAPAGFNPEEPPLDGIRYQLVKNFQPCYNFMAINGVNKNNNRGKAILFRQYDKDGLKINYIEDE